MATDIDKLLAEHFLTAKDLIHYLDTEFGKFELCLGAEWLPLFTDTRIEVANFIELKVRSLLREVQGHE